MTFLADVIAMGWASPNNARGIGVNQETALLMESPPPKESNSSPLKVSARVVANEGVDGAAYFLTAGSGSTISVPKSGNLTFTNIKAKICCFSKEVASRPGMLSTLQCSFCKGTRFAKCFAPSRKGTLFYGEQHAD